jgi:hypothetical protein
MSIPRLLRWSAVLVSVFALSGAAAQASWHKRGHDHKRGPDRVLYATTSQNQLISFNARNPDRIRDIQAMSTSIRPSTRSASSATPARTCA